MKANEQQLVPPVVMRGLRKSWLSQLKLIDVMTTTNSGSGSELCREDGVHFWKTPRRRFTNGKQNRSHGSKLKQITVTQSSKKDRRSSVLSSGSRSGLTSKIKVDDGGEETDFFFFFVKGCPLIINCSLI